MEDKSQQLSVVPKVVRAQAQIRGFLVPRPQLVSFPERYYICIYQVKIYKSILCDWVRSPQTCWEMCEVRRQTLRQSQWLRP